MVRCPVCGSSQITVVLAARGDGSCSMCGARWIQQGSEQRSIQRAPVSGPRGIGDPSGYTPWVKF